MLPADRTGLSNDFSLALASGASLSEHVIVPSSKIDFPCNSAFSRTFLTFDNIMRIIGSGSLAMRTYHLLLDHRIQFLPQIEILEI